MGANGEQKAGSDSGTGVQRATVVRKGSGDGGAECIGEWVVTRDRGFGGTKG